MVKHVVLTATAGSDLEQITDYLFNEWGYTVTSEFLNRFEKICILVSETPEVFPLVDKMKGLRKCVLTKHNAIYFREHSERIEVITIFDSRQDTDKLESLL